MNQKTVEENFEDRWKGPKKDEEMMGENSVLSKKETRKSNNCFYDESREKSQNDMNIMELEDPSIEKKKIDFDD